MNLVQESNRLGKASAVNLILNRARGENVVFISADVTPKPNCIQALIETMTDRTVGISCGKPVPIPRGRLLVRGIVATLWGFHNWQLQQLNDAGLLMHASEVFCIRRGIVEEIPRDMVNDDAYVAVMAKSRGYFIKYVPRSEVEVYGPQTVGDYLKQRRRIIVGHYQVRKETGKFSQFLFYSALTRPILTLKLLVEYLAQHRMVRDGVATAFLEFVANVLAGVDMLRGRSHAVWSISTTTKTDDEL